MKPDHPRHHGASNRFGLLLAIFIAQLITTPLFEGSLAAGYAGDTVFYLFLAAAAYSVRKSRFFKLTIVLGACAILGEGSSYFTRKQACTHCHQFHILHLSRPGDVFDRRRRDPSNEKVNADSVMGGLCVYILMGVFWTILFVNIEILNPGSFSFGVHGEPQNMQSLYKLMFFYSYVTLLTIGYGEVVALSGMAQTLTILEGLIGQFYLIFFSSWPYSPDITTYLATYGTFHAAIC